MDAEKTELVPARAAIDGNIWEPGVYGWTEAVA